MPLYWQVKKTETLDNQCVACQRISSHRLEEWVLMLNGKTTKSMEGRFCSAQCASSYFGEEVL